MPGRVIEVELRVADVERSASFYRDLGVPVGELEDHGGREEPHVHASWGKWSPDPDAGGFLLLNIYPATDGPTRSRLGVVADDLDALHEQCMRSGVDVVRAPESTPWGRTAVYRDPDGNIVSVTERPRAD